ESQLGIVPADLVDLVPPDEHFSVAQPRAVKGVERPVEDSPPADLDVALGLRVGHGLQARSAAGADDDGSHFAFSLPALALGGTAFQRGSRSSAARKLATARASNTPPQPHRLLRNPGRLPPSIPPSDPTALMIPAAVD